MRRLYKKPYPKPPKPKLRASQPLMQPEWDDTIHDLTQLRLSPQEQLRRRLQRVSKNQWGINALAKQLKAGDEDQLADTDGIQLEKNEAQDSTLQHHGQQSPGSCTTLSSDSEDDMCQYNQPRRTHAWHLHGSRPEDDSSDLQQGRTASCATAAGSQQQHGTTLLVDTGTLQALLAKIEALEAHLVQQQQEEEVEDDGDAAQHQPLHIMQQQRQQQSAANVLLQQLADSQQQLADLREQFQQHMAHSSSLITRLQAQLQQLLVRLPDGTMPGAILTLDSHSPGKVAPDAAQQILSHDVEQTSPHHRIGAAAPASACLSDTAVSAAPWYKSSSSSDNSSSSRLPTKLKHGLLAPAAIASTGSPQKAKSSPPPSATVGLQSAATGAARHQSSTPMGVMSSGAPGAAAVIAEEARLPSYLQMRQSRSLPQSSSAAATGASSTGLAERTAAAAGDVLYGGAAGEGLATTSNSCSRSQGDAALLQSRPVPSPLPADNPAAAVAAALSGESAQQWQAQCISRAAVGGVERWSDAKQVAPVMSSSQHRRLSALSTSLGLENDLPGLAAADYGLQEGLPRAAVGHIYTAAGCSEPMEMPQESRVVLEQLKGNVSLNDHIRAAAALKGCATNAVGTAAWWRI